MLGVFMVVMLLGSIHRPVWCGMQCRLDSAVVVTGLVCVCVCVCCRRVTLFLSSVGAGGVCCMHAVHRESVQVVPGF